MRDPARIERLRVRGDNVQTVIDGFGIFTFIATQHLLSAGIGRLGEDGSIRVPVGETVRVLDWTRMLDRVGKELGQPVLRQIGEAIPKRAIFPPHVVDARSALLSVDVAYHMNHELDGERAFDPVTGKMLEGIGNYATLHDPSKNEVAFEVDVPYPCGLDQGILLALARRFEPSGRIVHGAGPCRTQGDASCRYVVSWG
jgi:hypothetical protein